MTERADLTDDFIASIRPAAKERRIWDTTLRGFCARVHPSGRVVFCLRLTMAGKQRWVTIGGAGGPFLFSAG